MRKFLKFRTFVKEINDQKVTIVRKDKTERTFRISKFVKLSDLPQAHYVGFAEITLQRAKNGRMYVIKVRPLGSKNGKKERIIEAPPGVGEIMFLKNILKALNGQLPSEEVEELKKVTANLLNFKMKENKEIKKRKGE